MEIYQHRQDRKTLPEKLKGHSEHHAAPQLVSGSLVAGDKTPLGLGQFARD